MRVLSRPLRSLCARLRGSTTDPHLLPVGVAFPAAGLIALAAGHTLTQAEGARFVVETLGVKLPLVTQIVTGMPWLTCLALLALAAAILSTSYLRAPPAWSHTAQANARAVCHLVTIAALSLAGVAISALSLALATIHACLQA